MYHQKQQAYTKERKTHWDSLVRKRQQKKPSHYQRILGRTLRKVVGSGLDVLELGCGYGFLLSALKPRQGVGIDFSSEVVRKARILHPALSFYEADVHDFDLHRTFDIIILSDLLDDVWNVTQVLRCVKRHCNSKTRVVISSTSRLWQPLVELGRFVGLVTPRLQQSWLSPEDLFNLIKLEGYIPISQQREILFPFPFFGIERALNRFIAKLPVLDHLCLCNLFVIRPSPTKEELEIFANQSVSIVVAARNERGNLEDLVQRVPMTEKQTEIVFVEGGSSDGTFEEIQRLITMYPEKQIRLFKQPGYGKGDAIRKGFAEANGEVLVILDADMTVAPEEVCYILEVLQTGMGEFVNGVRLVYPREKKSMQYFNLIANKGFGFLFSWLIGQQIKDTLCGTKAIRKTDYEKIYSNRSIFGEFDPFGDFDLILGAARQNLHIVDFPVRYFDRIYGETNIKRWSSGLLLMRMSIVAALKLKFR